MSLAVSPGSAGFDTFDATLSDYDSGEPLGRDGGRPAVRARLPVWRGALEPRAGPCRARPVHGIRVEPVARRHLAGDGHGQRSQRSGGGAPGRGHAGARAGRSHTVVRHRCSDHRHRAPVRRRVSVQAYLDPGTAGPNELHLTFFDAAGTELPVRAGDRRPRPRTGGPAEVLEATVARARPLRRRHGAARRAACRSMSWRPIPAAARSTRSSPWRSSHEVDAMRGQKHAVLDMRRRTIYRAAGGLVLIAALTACAGDMGTPSASSLATASSPSTSPASPGAVPRPSSPAHGRHHGADLRARPISGRDCPCRALADGRHDHTGHDDRPSARTRATSISMSTTSSSR